MQNLYNSLINGEVEYKDDGGIIKHAPTTTALRAARALKQLADINDNNIILIKQLQLDAQNTLHIIEQKDLLIKELQNESLRKSNGQVSDVGSGSELPRGSDSLSEGSGEANGTSTSTNGTEGSNPPS